MAAVTALAFWRGWRDNARNKAGASSPDVERRRARGMRDVQLFVKIIGVPLVLFYAWLAKNQDNHVGLCLFLTRFSVVIFFSHAVDFRTMVNGPS